jgi:transposase-like protein
MKTIAGLLAQFPDEDACKAFLVQRRWKDGVRCPHCGTDKVTKLAKRPWSWLCRACDKRGYRFSPLVGTIFENTNIKLRTWFQAILLICQSKKGMSAMQIQRTLGLKSYESAWYMCHRIRAAMKNDEFIKLSGIVEVDETFVGGKAKNRHGGGTGGGRKKGAGGRGPAGKVPVIGAISRKGNVVCQVIEGTDAGTLTTFVDNTVSKDVELVATDEHAGYRDLNRHGFPHDAVNHQAGEYVRGLVHTGSIDSFWSLLKRGIMGSFHHVSKEYLPLYVNEFAFRHNHRNDDDMFGQVIAAC